MLSRRDFLSAVSCAAMVGFPLGTAGASNWKQKAHRAAEVLSVGKKAPLSDVQVLIDNLIPSIINESTVRVYRTKDHSIAYRAMQPIRLVSHGGKKKLMSLPATLVEVDLQDLLDFGILTEEGAQRITDRRWDIFHRRCGCDPHERSER